MGGAFFASLHVGATPGAPRSVLERAPLVADVRCRDGLPAPGEDVAVEDFLIPSLVRDFQDWNAPTVADGAAELLDLAGVSGTFDDKAAWISELFDDLLETLEPTQILLALTDHHVERIVVAASTGDLFPSLVLDRDMKLTALTRAGLPAPVTDALTSPTTVVALQLATRFDLTMPLADVHDGWLTIALDDGGGALDLDDVRDRLVRAVDGVHAALLDDIRDAVGETPLGELRDHPTIQSGLLTLYDPATWSFASVSDPDRDALDEADADALAVFALAEEVLIQVSAGDLDGFLREEVGRNLWGVVPCRSRFDDTRDERHLMRRGLRGARRRNRKLGVDGHRRDFRVGQARVLTYTEMILALHIQGVADILHTRSVTATTPRIVLEGDVGGDEFFQYVVARLPPPRQPPMAVTVKIVNAPTPPGTLSISYRRWGAEAAVAVDASVDANVDLSLASGTLALPLQVVDGAGTTPTLSICMDAPIEGLPGTPNLMLSGVQHGDVLIFEEVALGARTEIAVVKNLSLADLNRLHEAGYDVGVAAPFASATALAQAMRDTVAFILADGDGTAQDLQRRSLQASLAGVYTPAPVSPPKAYPATLDVPSAKGVGIFPDDASHLHLLLPNRDPRPDLTGLCATYEADSVAAAESAHFAPGDAGVDNPLLRVAVVAHAAAMRDQLGALLGAFEGATGATTIWHTYETAQATTEWYVDPAATQRLWPCDPVRNIRTDYAGAPTLFAVSDMNDALVGFADQGLDNELQVGVYVDRRAELQLYVVPEGVDISGAYEEALQVADALDALTGMSLPPTKAYEGGERPSRPPASSSSTSGTTSTLRSGACS